MVYRIILGEKLEFILIYSSLRSDIFPFGSLSISLSFISTDLKLLLKIDDFSVKEAFTKQLNVTIPAKVRLAIAAFVEIECGF